MSWPDWSGETCVIIGTGKSAVDVPLHLAREKARFIAIKQSWKLAPWSDVLYGVDPGWWVANNGVPEFKGMKVTPSPSAARVYGLRQVRLRPRAEVLTKEVGILGCGLKSGGGFSGFQAMNLAVQFWARALLLIGFDMTLANGAHWHKDQRGMGKPDADRTKRWRIALDAAAPQFAGLGVSVINCSAGSALKSYPFIQFSEAIGGHKDAA